MHILTFKSFSASGSPNKLILLVSFSDVSDVFSDCVSRMLAFGGFSLNVQVLVEAPKLKLSSVGS